MCAFLSVQVADMKNSVKDRSNAQCSCAGHFIESHIDPNYDGKQNLYWFIVCFV